MSYGSLFSCGNGKRGCFADVANMVLHVHQCPAPCRGQLLIMAYGFLESPDAPSESFLPLSAGLQGHHTQWASTDTRWSPELSAGAVLVLLQPVMWGSLAHPISCPGRRILLVHVLSSPVFSASECELQACSNALISHKQIFPSVGLFFI